MMIAWTLGQGSVSLALCGARTAAQARQNAAAGTVELDADALAQIEAAAKRHLSGL